MTEQEVIKALKLCLNATCKDCPMNGHANCITRLGEAETERIERQQLEVERLKSMNQAKLDCIHDLQRENEILSRNADTAFQDGLNEKRDLFEPEIKSEAYKEFAEKAAIELTNAYTPEYAHWIDDTLNNLLEELVGENK